MSTSLQQKCEAPLRLPPSIYTTHGACGKNQGVMQLGAYSELSLQRRAENTPTHRPPSTPSEAHRSIAKSKGRE
jgi:hypothetical protein